MNGSGTDGELFRLALSVLQETDPARSNAYFFDSSTVHVYLSHGASPFDFLSNCLLNQVG
ncbi:MAG: hypothetical protein HONDAALG_02624 [Gammaproteobacteria bacterium]|nr:hypothetical protein [Gammaproteobacteria bacterium]